MTQEEKIKEAKRLYKSANADQRYVLESLFPELKESEGERMMRVLIGGLKSYVDMYSEWYDGVSTSEIIAWLEKQGKKPDTNCLLSWSEMDEKMLQSLEGIVKDYWAKAEQEKNEIKIREASNVSYFLKTIQKSPLCWIKCSDGLPNKDGIYLVVTDGRHNDVYDMARYDSIEGWHKASKIIYWMPIPQLNNKSIIEQKPAWSEEDEEALEVAIIALEDMYSEDSPLDCYAGHHMTFDKAANQLKSLKDRVQPQPNQGWSEEDRKIIIELIGIFESAVDGGHVSFPYRLIKDYIRVLKSCLSQSTWKPSEEQITWLYRATDEVRKDSRMKQVLNGLLCDLKKLREE